MGEVWLGQDTRLGRPIAVKFIRADKMPDGRPDREQTERFVRESRITARLEHPGVPAVYDAGTDGQDLYMVMQLVDGCSLASLLDEVDEIPIAWAAAIGAQVCSVLAVAHSRSLIHRDLKPGNLMLCLDGTVKVLDFGIASALSSTETRLTRTGTVMGTPDYIAPEQAFEDRPGPQSDLYSLGVVLDELLTGRNQFAGATPLASAYNHRDVLPRPLRAQREEIPLGLEQLVLELLAKKPEDRPADATEVYGRLLEFCRELPPLTGYVDESASHPIRMYAAVVGRITSVSSPAAQPPPSKHDDTRMTYSDVALARKDASALMAESRFTQAAEVLAGIVEPAVKAFGPRNPDVINLRLELANVLFLGGDYRRAAPEFARLAADLARRDGPSEDLVLRCRRQEATCHAAVGETGLALTQLNELLEDEKRFGVDEERILDLRLQIGLLELGVGNPDAHSMLRDLRADFERRYGTSHPNVSKIRKLLNEEHS